MLIIIQPGTPRNRIKITIQQCKLKIREKSLTANNTKKKKNFTLGIPAVSLHLIIQYGITVAPL
jgi:hypothetical protein